MNPIVKYFTIASLTYLLLGAFIGLIMAIYPYSASYLLLTHVHLLLLGFVAMMIYSVGYHVLPRFSGFNLYSEKLITIQFFLTNIGLLGMSFTWIVSDDAPYRLIQVLSLSVFAAAEFTGIFIFIFNNIMTLSGKGGRMAQD